MTERKKPNPLEGKSSILLTTRVGTFKASIDLKFTNNLGVKAKNQTS